MGKLKMTCFSKDLELIDQGVYKFVRAWSRKLLEKAGEKVMDVQIDGEDDEEEEASTSDFTSREPKKDQ